MQNRRKFIQAVIRGSILGTFTLLSGILVRRWINAEDCQHNLACGNCNLSNKCKLPDADKYRLQKARLIKTNAENGKTGK